MNLIQYLLDKFIRKEWVNTIGMLITSILLTILHSAGISTVVSNLITMLQTKNMSGTTSMFKWFIGTSIAYLILNHIYKIFQNKLLTDLRQWVRSQILAIMLKINNNNFSDIDFTKMNSPINRISSTIFMSVNDWLSYIFPNIMFLLLMSIYFLYTNKTIGLIFIASIVIQFVYMWVTVDHMTKYNDIYEENVNDTENYMQEILNNFEKVISRGQVRNEIKNFREKSDITRESAYAFYDSSDNHGTIMNFIASITMFIIMWRLIQKYYKNKIPLTNVITIITILLLYRENMETLIKQIPDTLEFIGRAQTVLKRFEQMDLTQSDIQDNDIDDEDDESDRYIDEPIKSIRFENVTFKHKHATEPIIKNLNLEIRPHGGKIIGICGKSGSGKSTLAKMIIQMYQPTSGKIYINDSIGKELCRVGVVRYVDQKGKLWLGKMSSEMLYGGSLLGEVGGVRLGEYMSCESCVGTSGGERQVANVLSGLMQGNEILILDEPTNALDKELKMELLNAIKEYKEKKECIIIISHDKDVFPLFDETIRMGE